MHLQKRHFDRGECPCIIKKHARRQNSNRNFLDHLDLVSPGSHLDFEVSLTGFCRSFMMTILKIIRVDPETCGINRLLIYTKHDQGNYSTKNYGTFRLRTPTAGVRRNDMCHCRHLDTKSDTVYDRRRSSIHFHELRPGRRLVCRPL